MRQLTDGLSIPAHGAVRLAPGGYHMMFTHLAKPLTKGEKVTATLTFEHAGPVAVEFPVEAVGASGGGADEGRRHGGNEDVSRVARPSSPALARRKTGVLSDTLWGEG